MFVLTCIGWLIFRETELASAVARSSARRRRHRRDLADRRASTCSCSRASIRCRCGFTTSGRSSAVPIWPRPSTAPEAAVHWPRVAMQAVVCGLMLAAILTLRSQTALEFHLLCLLTSMSTDAESAAVICLAAVVGCAGAAPDTILVNGKIFTSNPAQPWAQAIAIRGDRIIAVGDTATIAALAGTVDAAASMRAAARSFPASTTRISTSASRRRIDRLDAAVRSDTSIRSREALARRSRRRRPGRLIEGEFSADGMGRSVVHARVARRDRAGSSGVADRVHRPRHAAQQPRARARSASTTRSKDPEGGALRPRRAGRLERPARGIRRSIWRGRRLALKTDPADVVAHLSAIRRRGARFGITQHAADGRLRCPIADVSKCLVEAGDADALEGIPFSDARGRRRNDRQPSAVAAAADAARRRARHEVDPRRHADRAARASCAQPYLDAPGERGRLNLPAERIEQFVGWAYGTEDPLAVHAVRRCARSTPTWRGRAGRTARSVARQAAAHRAWRHAVARSDRRASRRWACWSCRTRRTSCCPRSSPRATAPSALAWMQPMKSLLDAGIPLAIGSDGPMNPFLNIMAASRIRPIRRRR